ncbi:MAG TPA: ATP-binding protein [Ruminococcus flavefaciens]|nr:ATP-binding protein [Ruminococcus flavefaciens]
MSEEKRLLPVSVQSFEKLRESNCIYVDKTAYIYRLVHDVAQFFLSRPRRFGKSLLLSTIRAYWEGKKELFSGLAIEKLEADNPDAWKPHPVFYFDFNGRNYNKENALESVISSHLERWEEVYDLNGKNKSLEDRFQNLLISAHKQTGLRCVVLVDEYDKPLLDLIDDPELQEHNKAVFKGFFSNLKSCDNDIRFVFITGVTKFHKVSIFSDLNQLRDISLNEEFSAICGITDTELRANFASEIAVMAHKLQLSEENCLTKLKQQYDGYRFHQNGVNVYNPYSLINAFSDNEFGAYWFESGTPTFLIKQLRDMDFDVRRFTDHTIYADASLIKDYSAENPDPIPLLYQSGYLTIADYDPESYEYTLAFPNNEVKYGFLQNLMPEYVSDCGSSSGLDIFTFRRYIKKGDLESIRKVLTALFARITYTSSDTTFEHYFQTVIYLVFTLLGQFTDCEMHTFSGRIDCRVMTKDFIYLFEFKRDDSVEKALQQIKDKSYTLPFAADSRKLYKIGVSFDSEKRILADWKVEE